jgi:L-fuculose-phosphate aldolase
MTLMQELILLGQEIVRRGLVLGSGGNLSFRQGETMYITRSGALLHQLDETDFLPVPLTKPWLRPDVAPRPSTETPMHIAAYHARPQARTIVHCHPVSAIAWAMQERPLPATTPDFTLYLGPEVPVVPYFLPGSQALADAVTAALAQSPGVLMGNHGVLVCADTVARARLRLFHIDDAANICLRALAAGQLRPLQTAETAEIIAVYGSAKKTA